MDKWRISIMAIVLIGLFAALSTQANHYYRRIGGTTITSSTLTPHRHHPDYSAYNGYTGVHRHTNHGDGVFYNASDLRSNPGNVMYDRQYNERLEAGRYNVNDPDGVYYGHWSPNPNPDSYSLRRRELGTDPRGIQNNNIGLSAISGPLNIL